MSKRKAYLAELDEQINSTATPDEQQQDDIINAFIEYNREQFAKDKLQVLVMSTFVGAAFAYLSLGIDNHHSAQPVYCIIAIASILVNIIFVLSLSLDSLPSPLKSVIWVSNLVVSLTLLLYLLNNDFVAFSALIWSLPVLICGMSGYFVHSYRELDFSIGQLEGSRFKLKGA